MRTVSAALLMLGITLIPAPAPAQTLNGVESYFMCRNTPPEKLLGCKLLKQTYHALPVSSHIRRMWVELYRLHLKGKDSVQKQATALYAEWSGVLGVKRDPHGLLWPGLLPNAGMLLEDALINHLHNCGPNTCSLYLPPGLLDRSLTLLEQDKSGPWRIWRDIREIIKDHPPQSAT